LKKPPSGIATAAGFVQSCCISASLWFLLSVFAESCLVVVLMSGLGLGTVVSRVSARHFLVLPKPPPACHRHNAVPDSPNHHARNKSEQRGYDQNLDWVDPMKDDNLVKCIQHDGDEENLAGNSP